MSEKAGARGRPSAARWAAIEAAFGEAESLPEGRRAGFLASLARDDPELADEVRSLLGARDAWWLDQAIAKLPRAAQPEAERIGPYELVRPLGHGGMGEVWLAVREGTDFRQHVAVKITRRGLESAELLAAFRAERQILASLNHPNIAHLLDVGEGMGGRPYLALEYVEGLPLTVYCDRHRLSLERRIALFRTVCDAVRYAHRNLVVHRDLKPSNILVTGDGTVKLLDFGTAKVLHAATDMAGVPVTTPDQVLTPDYAAPEQVEGGTVTTASDVYSLGVVLYELLAGRRPFRLAGRSGAELRELIRTAQAVPPSDVVRGDPPEERQLTAAARSTTAELLARRLAGDLDAIVLRAMRTDPEQRYSSVDELMADLDRAASGRPVRDRQRADQVPSDMELADALTTLGELYARRNEPGRAIPFFTEALEIRTSALGADHPSAAAIREAIAQLDPKRR
jgi:serine/threonine-protein kinase